jgi:hypothetical protein
MGEAGVMGWGVLENQSVGETPTLLEATGVSLLLIGRLRRCEDVGVAHAVVGDFLADEGPVHFSAAGDVDLASAMANAVLP